MEPEVEFKVKVKVLERNKLGQLMFTTDASLLMFTTDASFKRITEAIGKSSIEQEAVLRLKVGPKLELQQLEVIVFELQCQPVGTMAAMKLFKTITIHLMVNRVAKVKSFKLEPQ